MASTLQYNPFTTVLDYVGAGGGAGTPGGPNGAVQFNNAGVFGGDAGYTWLTAPQRLGIGTSTPGVSLHVVGNTQQTIAVEDANDTAATAPRVALQRARGTEALPTPALSGTILGQLLWLGYDGGTPGPPLGFPFSTASIQAVADETFAAGTNYGGHLRFFTTLIGTAGALERLRIADDGSVLIGTTTKITGDRVVVAGGALHLTGGNLLKLQGGGAGFTSFFDPSHAANFAYSLPGTFATTGQVLQAQDNAGTLQWGSPSSAPTGPAGGDLAGAYPNPTVAQVNGALLGPTTPLVRGDLLVANATPAFARFPISSAGTVLRSAGLDPAWSTFTISNTFAQGDLLFASAANVLTALAKNATASRYLANTGGSNAPAWDQVNLSDGVTNTLLPIHGGTGLSGPNPGISGGILAFTSTSNIVSSALLTQHALVLGGGAGAAPATPVGLGTTTTVLHGNAAGDPSFAAVSLTADVSGTLPIGSGGTGQITAPLAFNALSPLTTRGDLLTRNATDNVRIPLGSVNQHYLRSPDGTAEPVWVDVTLFDDFFQYTLKAGRTSTTNDTILSTDSDGTLTGSAFLGGGGSQGAGLRLIANSTATGVGVAKPIFLQPNWGTLASGRNAILSFNAPITLLAGATVVGYEVGSLNAVSVTWKTQLVSAASSPHFLFNFAPTLTNDPSGTARGTGLLSLYGNGVILRGDNAQLRSLAIRTVRNLMQTSVVGTGTVLIDELTEVYTNPGFVAGTTVTARRGLWFRDQATASIAAMPTDIAVDVDEQTSSGAFTTVAAVRSALAQGANKWHLLGTGTADSALAGSVRLGAVAVARGGSILDVDGGLTARRTSAPDADYTVLVTDLIIEFPTLATTTRVVNLPAVATVAAGKVYIIAKNNASANDLTVTPNGTEKIDGAASKGVGTAAFSVMRVYSTGVAGFEWKTF